ncbi:MAG: hypothetical protein ACXU89_18785 [Xanthobacteraceae bacterium]
MLIRDLELGEWGMSKAWLYRLVRLNDERSLFICTPSPSNECRHHGLWTLYFQIEPLSAHGLAENAKGIIASHEDLEEFEAQAVLDYYLQTNPER